MTNRKLVQFVVIIIVLVLFMLFFLQFKEEVQKVRIENPIYLLPIIILYYGGTVINGLINHVIWVEQGLRLSMKEWYGLSVVNTFANFILPLRGGLVTVAAYLKRKHSFSYSKFVTFISASYIIIFWVNSAAALLGMMWLKYNQSYISWILTAFFMASLLFFTVIIVLSPKIPLTKYSFANRFIQVINDWYAMRRNYRLHIKIALLALVNLVLSAGMIFFQFRVIGFEINASNALILSVISGFSLLLSITPGNLGVREGVTALTSEALRIPAWQTVLVGIIDRILGFILISLIAPIFIASLSINLRVNEERSIDK